MAEYFYGITDKGKCRDKNEDTFFAREIAGKKYLVAGVIDGVGGYKGGDIAAGIARSVIIENLEELSENVIEVLRGAVIAANLKISQEKKAAGINERMACVLTCVVADIANNKCWYAHVGDTRIYLLRDHSLVKISKDHSAVGFLEESGRLSEEEAMRHPRRNEINKALGFEDDISTPEDFIETGESPFLPGDLLLLCSDGLTDMISSHAIKQLLTTKKSISSKGKALIDAANDAGGSDNITAVLVENNNWPKQKGEPVRIARKKGEITASAVSDGAVGTPENVPVNEGDRSPIAFFVLLLIGLAAVFLTVAFQKNDKPVSVDASLRQITKEKDKRLIQLIARLNDSSNSYGFSTGRTVLEIADPIVISKNSFRLSGSGTVFIGENSYKGPALIVNSNAKQVELDSLVFENFDVGIVVRSNNITLKNVRFINCRIPVQYDLSFPDSAISGRFKDSIFISQPKLK